MKHNEATFRERIYLLVSQIPRGKVASYGLIAIFAGREGAARAVGTAMAEVPRNLKLPCHRVLKSDGSLAPPYLFQGRQKQLLEKEKVVFKANGRVDMERCEWQIDDGVRVDMPGLS